MPELRDRANRALTKRLTESQTQSQSSRPRRTHPRTVSPPDEADEALNHLNIPAKAALNAAGGGNADESTESEDLDLDRSQIYSPRLFTQGAQELEVIQLSPPTSQFPPPSAQLPPPTLSPARGSSPVSQPRSSPLTVRSKEVGKGRFASIAQAIVDQAVSKEPRAAKNKERNQEESDVDGETLPPAQFDLIAVGCFEGTKFEKDPFSSKERERDSFLYARWLQKITEQANVIGHRAGNEVELAKVTATVSSTTRSFPKSNLTLEEHWEWYGVLSKADKWSKEGAKGIRVEVIAKFRQFLAVDGDDSSTPVSSADSDDDDLTSTKKKATKTPRQSQGASQRGSVTSIKRREDKILRKANKAAEHHVSEIQRKWKCASDKCGHIGLPCYRVPPDDEHVKLDSGQLIGWSKAIGRGKATLDQPPRRLRVYCEDIVSTRLRERADKRSGRHKRKHSRGSSRSRSRERREPQWPIFLPPWMYPPPPASGPNVYQQQPSNRPPSSPISGKYVDEPSVGAYIDWLQSHTRMNPERLDAAGITLEENAVMVGQLRDITKQELIALGIPLGIAQVLKDEVKRFLKSAI